MIGDGGALLPSVWAGLPVIMVFLLLCALGIKAAWKHLAVEDDASMAWLCTVILAIMGVGAGIGAAIGYWPYSGDYHRLRPVTGTVAAIDSRFLTASQYVVITYAEGAVVRCDDSRCATVAVGQSLRLLCTREYEYGAVNGWGCRWGQPE